VRFEYVGLRVSDLRRSVRFYTRALGLRVISRGDGRAWGGGRWVLLRDPRSGGTVELNWYPKGSRFAEPFRHGSEVDHLDFTLGRASRTSLERTFRRLVRAGARPTRYRPSTTDGWRAMVRDPDGIWINIGRTPTAREGQSRDG
jgi:catechol 2,3-dioxygenase-like lactoylglutathione lyase family enzyme